jgi:hypothetical protein
VKNKSGNPHCNHNGNAGGSGEESERNRDGGEKLCDHDQDKTGRASNAERIGEVVEFAIEAGEFGPSMEIGHQAAGTQAKEKLGKCCCFHGDSRSYFIGEVGHRGCVVGDHISFFAFLSGDVLVDALIASNQFGEAHAFEV